MDYSKLCYDLDVDLVKNLQKCGYNSNKQIFQDEINAEIIRLCNPESALKAIKNFDEYNATDIEKRNYVVKEILKHIIHKDTKFCAGHVRIQGLISLDYLSNDNTLPTSCYHFIKGTNYLYVGSLIFYYV